MSEMSLVKQFDVESLPVGKGIAIEESVPGTTLPPPSPDAGRDHGRPGSPSDQVAEARADWGRERPELDTAPMEVFGRLIRTRMLAESLISAELDTHGLSLPSFDVLASLRRAGPPFRKTPTELATTSMLTTGGVTFRLDRLESAGLIRRVRSTDDRRVVYAELTGHGRDMIDAAFEAHLANERAMLAGLDEHDAEQLSHLLRRLEASMLTAKDDRPRI